jgi:YggT family protein
MSQDVAITLISLLRIISQVFYLVLIAYILLGYFLSPYHPLRMALGRVIEPLLVPIRRLMPNTGMIDFSPMVLLLLMWLVMRILEWLILAFV